MRSWRTSVILQRLRRICRSFIYSFIRRCFRRVIKYCSLFDVSFIQLRIHPWPRKDFRLARNAISPRNYHEIVSLSNLTSVDHFYIPLPLIIDDISYNTVRIRLHPFTIIFYLIPPFVFLQYTVFVVLNGRRNFNVHLMDLFCNEKNLFKTKQQEQVIVGSISKTN